MRKVFFIGLIVCVLAISAIGAAFAANVTFSGVGSLAMGSTSLSSVGVD